MQISCWHEKIVFLSFSSVSMATTEVWGLIRAGGNLYTIVSFMQAISPLLQQMWFLAASCCLKNVQNVKEMWKSSNLFWKIAPLYYFELFSFFLGLSWAIERIYIEYCLQIFRSIHFSALKRKNNVATWHGDFAASSEVKLNSIDGHVWSNTESHRKMLHNLCRCSRPLSPERKTLVCPLTSIFWPSCLSQRFLTCR